MKNGKKRINGNNSIERKGKIPARHKKLSLQGYLINNLRALDP